MQATIVDLRYRMNDVLKALSRNEEVEILYRGKTKGVLRAAKTSTVAKVCDHPFFNMQDAAVSVEEQMDSLREGRFRDL